MIELELKKKDVDIRYREDPLTSVVFGFLKYQEMNDIFLYFIGQAINTENGNNFDIAKLKNKNLNFKFWEKLRTEENKNFFAEIDIYIETDKYKLGIEIKYYSGEHQSKHKKKIKMQKRTVSVSQLEKYKKIFDDVIYITTDMTMPSNFKKDKKIYWLSWNILYKVLMEYMDKETSNLKKEIIKDLLIYLENRNIYYFKGFGAYTAPPNLIGENIFWEQHLFNFDFKIPKYLPPVFFNQEDKNEQ